MSKPSVLVDNITPFFEANFEEEELDAYDFYRWLFPAGSFEAKGVYSSAYTYNAVAVEVTDRKKKVPVRVWNSETKRYEDDPVKRKEKAVVRRYTVTDDLDVINDLQTSPYFCLMSPLSYVGKERSSENARECYAIVIDLDMIKISGGYPVGVKNLLDQMTLSPEESMYALPPCSAIVTSGTGVHVYYILEEPIPLFPNLADQLQKLKRALTNRIWNDEVVDIRDRRDVQQEGIYQGFRIVGTVTKVGTRARAFRLGEKVSIDMLNQYVSPKERAELGYIPRKGRSRAEAFERWPDWAERVKRKDKLRKEIDEKRKLLEQNDDGNLKKEIAELQNELLDLDRRKVWAVNRNIYEWWKRQIREGAVYGHRYWCIAMLAVFARKASYLDVDHPSGKIDKKTGEEKIRKGKNPDPVTYEELEQDAMGLIPFMNSRSPENEFTEEDVIAALEYYNDGWTFYPREYIEYHSAIPVPKNEKRKGQKQEWHLEDIRQKKENMKRRGEPFKNPEGRPPMKYAVEKWRHNHPDGKKAECARDLGISRTTVHKWWEVSLTDHERRILAYRDAIHKSEEKKDGK